MSDDYDWTPHLQEGEEVLWQGRPDGRYRLFLRDADYLLVPFWSIFFIAGLVAGFSSVVAFGSGAAPEEGLAIFAVITLSLSTYVIFIRSNRDKRRRRATSYAITNKRVLLANSLTGILRHFEITGSMWIDVTLGRFSTIRFASKPQPYAINSSPVTRWGINRILVEAMIFGYVEQGYELRRIPDGKDVARLLKSLRSQASEATP
ncbi:hypothetical protein A8B78_03490 [Jannaschia sp. EhC01]|nr:hypothetical protein A8B78_03490 [Jannaschia sp. EhC01]